MSYIQNGGGGGGSGTVTNTAGNLTANQLIIGNGGADEKILGTLGTATTVLHGNAGGAPTFGAVALGTDVSGTLAAANGGVANVSVAGQGYFVSDGWLRSPEGVTDILIAISASANQVKCAQFVLPITITVTRITMTFGTATAGTANCGIWDAPATTKLIDSGNFNANSATTQTLTIGAVTLTPGVYWFGAACSNTSTTATSFANPGTTPATPIWNNVAARVGTAANTSAGGLPATLGAITGTAVNLPMAMFEFA